MMVQVSVQNWSNRTIGYRSSGKRDANKDMSKNGLHQGRSNFNEPQAGGSQPRSNLRCRKDTNNGPSHGRTPSLDELPGGLELRRLRPIYLGP